MLANKQTKTLADRPSILYLGRAQAGKHSNLSIIAQTLKNQCPQLGLRLSPTQIQILDPRGPQSWSLAQCSIAEFVVRQERYGDIKRLVFVIDSQLHQLADHLRDLYHCEMALRQRGQSLKEKALVFQWNKQDQPGALLPCELNRRLNKLDVPHFAAQAHKGWGVFECLASLANPNWLSADLITLIRRQALLSQRQGPRTRRLQRSP